MRPSEPSPGSGVEVARRIPDGTDPVGAARRLAARVRETADEAERELRLPPSLVEPFVEQGFFRMLVPRSLGGGEADPATFVATVEELARADGAAGWCVAVGATSGMLAAYLPEAEAREVYGHATSVVGGVFAPKGRAVVEADRYHVSGRWPFASGIDYCDWLMGGCVVEENGSHEALDRHVVAAGAAQYLPGPGRAGRRPACARREPFSTRRSGKLGRSRARTAT